MISRRLPASVHQRIAKVTIGGNPNPSDQRRYGDAVRSPLATNVSPIKPARPPWHFFRKQSHKLSARLHCTKEDFWGKRRRGWVQIAEAPPYLCLQNPATFLFFLPSTVHFVIQRSAFTLFHTFISIYLRFLDKCGPVRALQRRILALSSGIETMTNRTTPKILSHILKITNHVLFQRDAHRALKSTDELFACRPQSSCSVIRAISLTTSL